MRAQGIDVSHHHPVTDFMKIVDAGMTIFGAKATNGRGIDPTFVAHRDGAREKPFDLVLYYHFPKPGTPREQAEHFVDEVGPLHDNERLVIDVEWDRDTDWCPDVTWVDAFVHELLGRVGDRRPLVYTSPRVWADYLHGDFWSRAIATDLWIPRYGSGDHEPAMPSDKGGFPLWPKWTIWQDSESFVCPGVDGPCDHNVFNGDADELRRYTRMIG
jgi:lysozyme